MAQPLLSFVASAALLAGASAAQAVIVAGPQARNTAAPTGTLADSGWQWQGQFGPFLGTAIAPNWFITAEHIGVGASSPFVYRNAQGQPTSYSVAQIVDDPSSDLRLVRVNGTLSSFAPIWDGGGDGSELNRSFVVIGRGTQRGAEVFGPSSVASPTRGKKNSQFKGWLWGSGDGVQAWGTNVATSFVDGGPTLGSLIYGNFSRAGGDNEAMLSAGDSGGGLFMQNAAGQWKLAGINYGAEFLFARTQGGETFAAALHDMGGFYAASTNPYTFLPEQTADRQAGFYSTRVSSRLAWINGVITAPPPPAETIAVPEPASMSLLALSSVVLLRRRRS
jgi:hypothetical protein